MKPAEFLVLTFVISVVHSSKILVVFPMEARSHYILGNALARILAEAGHDVTMISPFEEKDPPKNGTYRNIVLTGLLEERESQGILNTFHLENLNPFVYIPLMNFAGSITRKTLEHPNFQELIKSNEHFDVVIIEQFFNDGLKVLSHHYKAPLILFCTTGINVWINPLVGNPSPLSYIPDIVLSYTDHMTFWQRVMNTLFSVFSDLNRYLIFFPLQNWKMKQYFPDAPNLNVLNYNASLALVNSHESIYQAVPHVPNMIDVGGFHINPPKELPVDLKEFIDGAEEGVVYFSMGSNIKPSDMSAEKRQIILNALGKLRQKVLWKWNEDTLPGIPANVKISKWFPQQDILAHPNTKLFITHGGLLSISETVYYGVPILALPIYGDQKMNAILAEKNGIGITLSFSQITEEKLSDTLHKLLRDPKYRENVKLRSDLMHDRPTKPKDLVLYWTEFVIRHNGAPHLRVTGLDLPWYQYFLLDVVLFLSLVGISLIIVLYVLIRRICCTVKKSKEKLKTG